MEASIFVLIETDEINKIYYVEEKKIPANFIEEINRAFQDYKDLIFKARINGYQIIKREKNVTPMDDGTEIDDMIKELGGPKL